MRSTHRPDENMVRRPSIRADQNQNLTDPTSAQNVNVNLESLASVSTVPYVFFSKRHFNLV